MKTAIYPAIILALSGALSTTDEVVNYLNLGMPLHDESIGGDAMYNYYFKNYKNEYLDQIIKIAAYEDSPEMGDTRVRAFSVLVTIPEILSNPSSLDKVEKIATKFESDAELDNTSMTNHGTMDRLRTIYYTIAASGLPQAADFLRQRTSFEFWQDRKMPSIINPGQGGDLGPTHVTSQADAISAMGAQPSPQAEIFLKGLLQNPRYTNDEFLKQTIVNSLSERHGLLVRYQTLVDIWKKHGLTIPSYALAINQMLTPSAEQPTSPMTKHSAVATTAKPTPVIAQTDAGSSFTFLILVTLGVVIVTALFLRSRRK